MPPGGEAVHCKSHTTWCLHAVRQCIAQVPLPTAPSECGTALQDFGSLGSDRLLDKNPRPPS